LSILIQTQSYGLRKLLRSRCICQGLKKTVGLEKRKEEMFMFGYAGDQA
jgi:hypothetical protein